MDRLQGVVQDYDWGDRRAIAAILGHEPPGHPEAEYWLGAHPKAPSLAVGHDERLDAMVAGDRAKILGPEIAQRFSGLPYLLKILAAQRPLSIQAHPSRVQAKAGFAREEMSGIDRLAPNRNYRDDNHKPELICALTDFEAKCGFRDLSSTDRLLAVLTDAGGASSAGLAELRARLGAAGPEAERLAAGVSWLLHLPRPEAAALVAAVVEAAARCGPDGPTPAAEFSPELEWTGRINQSFPGDVGTVVGLLLNHVTLAPGQAVFLGAGNLHCYLQGVGIELMANSDNVLRGGLTTKHVDVEELLTVVDYEPANPPIQTAGGAVHRFDVPVPEFGLERLASTDEPFDDLSRQVMGPEILLVTSGAIELTSGPSTLELRTGQAALVHHADRDYIVSDLAPGKTVAWRATVG